MLIGEELPQDKQEWAGCLFIIIVMALFIMTVVFAVMFIVKYG